MARWCPTRQRPVGTEVLVRTAQKEQLKRPRSEHTCLESPTMILFNDFTLSPHPKKKPRSKARETVPGQDLRPILDNTRGSSSIKQASRDGTEL